MKNSSIKIDIHSLYEILQDNFSIAFLGKVLNRINNIEAKNAIQEFIIDFSPVLIYEAYLYLKNNNLIEENKFYKNQELKNKVAEYRMLTTKKQVKKSDYIKSITEKMGIVLSEDVYDINVISGNNQVKGFNFAEYKKREEKKFLEMCYSTNLEFSKVTFKEITGISEIDYNNIINMIIENKIEDIEKLEKSLAGVRYSYKSSKVFKDTTIQDEDKFFILYRFNTLNTIIELKKFLKTNEVVIDVNNGLSINIDKFIDKIIALEIDILGRDIQSLNTEYIKKLGKELDEKMLKDKKIKAKENFYQLSRKLRNNIHYNKIEELDEELYVDVVNLQEEYLDKVYNEMKKNIYFSLDEEDILMNDFFQYCNENNISQEEIMENYNDYYIQYYYKKYIDRKL